MNTRIVLRQNYAYLKGYNFHLLSFDDIKRLQNGDFYDELQSIPLDNRIFLIIGFQYCLDSFGKRFYFKGLGVNIYFDQNNKCYYYSSNNVRIYMHYLSDLQHFMELHLNCIITDFSDLSKYINELYSWERRLSLLSPKERDAEIDNSIIRTINLKRKKHVI